MELQQLRYFMAICERGSFTRAADQCAITQPALTRAIRKLEEELGGTLFDRDASGTQLSRFGRSVRPFLEQTLRAADAARVKARNFLRSDSNQLRLGVAPTMPPAMLIRPLSEIRRKIAEFGLELTQSDVTTITQQLEDGDLEVAIVPAGVRLPERVHQWPLYEVSARLAVPAQHALASLPEVPPEALDGEVWIDRADCPLSRAFMDHCTGSGIQLSVRHRATSDDQVQHLVAAGFGCSILSSHTLPVTGVVTRQIQGFDERQQVVLMAVAGRPFNKVSEVFVRLARARDWSSLQSGDNQAA